MFREGHRQAPMIEHNTRGAPSGAPSSISLYHILYLKILPDFSRSLNAREAQTSKTVQWFVSTSSGLPHHPRHGTSPFLSFSKALLITLLYFSFSVNCVSQKKSASSACYIKRRVTRCCQPCELRMPCLHHNRRQHSCH